MIIEYGSFNTVLLSQYETFVIVLFMNDEYLFTDTGDRFALVKKSPRRCYNLKRAV